MRIGELSTRTGSSVRSLRYYEERGLIASRRTGGGHREFDTVAQQRVETIRCLLDAGVPTRDIEEMLPCVHTGVTTPTTMDRLSDAHRRLSQQIEDLLETRSHLEVVMDGVRANIEANGEQQLAG